MAYIVIPIIQSIWSYLWWFFRPYVKGFLRRTTKLCELQRICYGERRGYSRTTSIEFCLNSSKNSEIKSLVSKLNELADTGRFTGETTENAVEYAFKTIVEIKAVNLKIHRMFKYSLTKCIVQTFGHRQLLTEVEFCRKINYSADDPVHEAKLIKLWELLMPDIELSKRVSKQWNEIGFQGEDPKTDFRGMGILGLENLLYFATHYNKAAQHVLTHSHHPTYGYSFAIVGINLTNMAYQLLKEGKVKSHLYNAVLGQPQMQHFHQFYCYIFFEFDKTWLAEKPRDVMEFNRIRDKFQNRLEIKLQNPDVILKLNMATETL